MVPAQEPSTRTARAANFGNDASAKLPSKHVGKNFVTSPNVKQQIRLEPNLEIYDAL